MRLMLIIVLCCSVIVSCGHDDTETCLTSSELNMEDNPELSLKILKAINTLELTTERQQARYSLLYSIALDKNLIDITSDSIIAPAVKYYEKHGCRNYRFICHYYEARVYENAGDLDKALLCISKAESIDTLKIDTKIISLLFAMKGAIYDKVWRTQEAADAWETARKYALISGNYRHYAYYSLSCAISYMKSGKIESSKHCISDAEKYKKYFTLIETHLYNDILICNMLDANLNSKEILSHTERYIKEYPDSNLINWRNISRVYLNAGKSKQAFDILKRQADYYDISKDAGYYAILSEILEQQQDYKGALEASNKYSQINDAIDMALHKSDIKLIEERYRHQINMIRQRHHMSYIIAVMFIACLLIGYTYIYRHKELQRNKRDIKELQHEYDILLTVKDKISNQYQVIEKTYKKQFSEYSRLKDTYNYLNEQIERLGDTNKDSLLILGHRIKSLAVFLQKPIPDSLSKVAAQIKDIKKNRSYIVDSIGILYAVNYPAFVSELRKFGLTSSEIGYCCLFIMGLSMPEAGDVIGKSSSIYNINSAIRKKLKLPTSTTNLDKWLIKRFEELYPANIA